MWTAVLLCACAAAAALTSSSDLDVDRTPGQARTDDRVGFQRQRDSSLHDGRPVNAVPSRPRRLMGIIRCYGWGPGCSSSDPYSLRRRPSKPRASHAPDQQLQISGPEAEREEEPEVPQRKPPPSSHRAHQTASKFYPFFTLTSGGSWARTDRKRLHTQRSTASDRRIDFLEQILRDMLDEQDDEYDHQSSASQADDTEKRRDVLPSDTVPSYVTRRAVDDGKARVETSLTTCQSEVTEC